MTGFFHSACIQISSVIVCVNTSFLSDYSIVQMYILSIHKLMDI